MLRDLVYREPNREYKRFQRNAVLAQRLLDTEKAINKYLKDNSLSHLAIYQMNKRPKEYMRLLRLWGHLYDTLYVGGRSV